MALTPLQRDVCRLLADARRASGESYVAGGVALSEALAVQRLSRDLDIFHDTTQAVASSWEIDRRLLESAGYTVEARRERPGFVEAAVRRDDDVLIVEWLRDSAYRFFPLVEHTEFGLVLHPFDLATNKLLALIGRTEARDWIDIIACHQSLQPLGYLSWAACAKDPGFTPSGILAHAGRASHYSQAEIDTLAFDGDVPRADALSRAWHAALDEAEILVTHLPAENVGAAVLNPDGTLFRGDAAALGVALKAATLQFHAGRIRGAWPRVR